MQAYSSTTADPGRTQPKSHLDMLCPMHCDNRAYRRSSCVGSSVSRAGYRRGRAAHDLQGDMDQILSIKSNANPLLTCHLDPSVSVYVLMWAPGHTGGLGLGLDELPERIVSQQRKRHSLRAKIAYWNWRKS